MLHVCHVKISTLRCPREEKSDLEMEYEARLREMDEKHQHELQELENAYQQTIMGEVERYQVTGGCKRHHWKPLQLVYSNAVTPLKFQRSLTPGVVVLQWLVKPLRGPSHPTGTCTRAEHAAGAVGRTTTASRYDT